MELSFHSLDAVGYHDQPVPNTFITNPNPANHLGIILPGYRYAADMPPLHYTRRLLLDQGADILSVDYVYYRTDFMKQPEAERDQWISADVLAACNAVLSQRLYEKITLVGKSLGTIAMGQLLADHRFQQAGCIWLTPLLMVNSLCSRIEQFHPPSLFIIGTADPYFLPDILLHLQDVTHGHSVVIEGANHALEIPDDIQKTIQALNPIVQGVQEFLAGMP